MVELTNGMSALAFRNGLNTNFNELNLAAVNPIVAAESLTSDDLGKIHLLSGISSNYTVDLPTAVGNDTKILIFKGLYGLTKDVTLQGVSGQLIDTEANRKLTSGGSITLMSDGAHWIVINEVGSWVSYTPVWTGFSADPTLQGAKYFRQGKICTVKVICATSGTSNATTTTITLPFNSLLLTIGVLHGVANNGSLLTVHGRIDTRAASNVADLYTSAGAAAWTSSSTKRGSFVLTYELA